LVKYFISNQLKIKTLNKHLTENKKFDILKLQVKVKDFKKSNLNRKFKSIKNRKKSITNIIRSRLVDLKMVEVENLKD